MLQRKFCTYVDKFLERLEKSLQKPRYYRPLSFSLQPEMFNFLCFKVLFRRVADLLAIYDVIVLLTVPFEAPKLGETACHSGGGGGVAPMNTNACIFNICGHPAMTVNCGYISVKPGHNTMPVGIQIVSGAFKEAILFKVAAAIEKMNVPSPLLCSK